MHGMDGKRRVVDHSLSPRGVISEVGAGDCIITSTELSGRSLAPVVGVNTLVSNMYE